MTVCSQHASCTKTAMDHGERIASLETRVDKVEEVQEGMVSELKDAAAGLRALAGKIDSVVSTAKSNGVCMTEENCEPRRSFSGSINHAWRHFQDNLALFIIYASAGLLAWMVVKTMLFKEIPPILKNFIR